MRYLRMGIIFLFAISVALYGFAGCQTKIMADTTIPTMTSEVETLEIPCTYTDKEILSGLHAQDERDGDLTDNIMLSKLSRFKKKGKCEATYVVFDSANHSTTLKRDIVFTDYHSPKFTLEAPLSFVAHSTEMNQLKVGAMDMLDGDISSLVGIKEDNINYAVVGDYWVQVEVMNSFGDTSEMKLPVHVISPEEAQIPVQLNQYLVYLKKGESFYSKDYIKSVNHTDDIDSVKIDSNVDMDVPGCYEVKYTAVGENGNMGVSWLTVVVE